MFAVTVNEKEQVFAGGFFTNAGGLSAHHIALWDGTSWSALGRGMDEQVTDLAVDLYAAGWFKRAGDVKANGIARWDSSSWSALGNELNMGRAVETAKDGEIYATGMFFIPPVSNTFAHYIARWDGMNWNPLGKGVDNFVSALAVDPEGNLYATGDFTSAGGMPALRIARWDDMSFYLFIRSINGGYKSSSLIVCHSLSM